MPDGRTLRMCLIHRQLSKSMINHLYKIRIINDVIFLFQYADPVADLLDKWDVFASRLFRESCVFHRGNYVKDLSRLGRELHKIIIVDNSPASYVFHPDNAVRFFSLKKIRQNVTGFTEFALFLSVLTIFFYFCFDQLILYFKVPCSSWFDDMEDRELLELIPLLEKLSKIDSVYTVLKNKDHQGGGQVVPGPQSIGSKQGSNSLKRSGSASAVT